MPPQSGADAPRCPGCLRLNKDLRHLKPVCASLYPGSNWKRLGTAGDRPAVYLPHLSELAAEKHVFCPKRAGPILFVTGGSRCRHRTWHVTSIPATRGEHPHRGKGRVALPQAVRYLPGRGSRSRPAAHAHAGTAAPSRPTAPALASPLRAGGGPAPSSLSSPPPPHARRVGPGRPPGGKSGSSRLSLALARRAGLHRRCAPPRGGPARFPPPFPRRGVVRLAVWRSRRSGAVAGLGQGNGGLSLG